MYIPRRSKERWPPIRISRNAPSSVSPMNVGAKVGHLVQVLMPNAELDFTDIIAHLEPRLARYKIPKHLSVMDQSAAKRRRKKLMKAALRAMLGAEVANNVRGLRHSNDIVCVTYKQYVTETRLYITINYCY